ncbi:MAG: ABC transporter permease, partial [Candidatus Delongbacteria bacterium]|nr:ABC transporter permease [Candidatus Delongbacteria bacterium]
MFKMALRNIFRNGKRSMLTMTVVIIGIAGVVLGLSWVSGAENTFIEEGTKFTGEIRITRPDFEMKERSMDVSSNFDHDEIKAALEDIGGIESTAGRIKFGGVIFSEDDDYTAMGTAVEEQDYDNIRFVDYIFEGRYLDFESEEPEILVGEKVKEKLKLKLGDEITILTSTQYTEMSAYNYKIAGFYRFDNSRMNRSFYLKLSDAQYLLNMEGAVTEYLIYLDDIGQTDRIVSRIENRLDAGEYLIMPWHKIGMNEFMTQMLPLMKTILSLILALLSGVGIANTMVMVVFERKKEIGVLKAMGMKNKNIVGLLTFEGMMIGLAGTILGLILGSLISYYFMVYGVEIGDAMELVSAEVNVKSTIYMKLKLSSVI